MIDRQRLGSLLGSIIAGTRDHYVAKGGKRGSARGAAEAMVEIIERIEALEAENARLREGIQILESSIRSLEIHHLRY